jgi:hypothetical protein
MLQGLHCQACQAPGGKNIILHFVDKRVLERLETTAEALDSFVHHQSHGVYIQRLCDLHEF